MRSLVAPKPCKPSGYEIVDLPLPPISNADEMLVKVHACGLMTGDTQVASGSMSFLVSMRFPAGLGIECSGTVVSVGSNVTNFKPGDAVYGMAFGRPMEFDRLSGFCSQYCIGREKLFLHKPPHISFEEAGGLLSFTLTAYESLQLGAKHMASHGKKLEGSTVFVPGALSATGSICIQLLKNVFGVSKVIATVSTSKIPLVEKYLPGLVDQVVDYKLTRKLTDVIPAGGVDFAYNTQWNTLESVVPLMNKDTGVIVSIASIFPSRLLKLALGPALPFWVGWIADLAQLYYRWLVWGTNIKLDFVSGNGENRELVEKTAEVIALQKVKCVMRIVNLENIEAVRVACDEVYTGKGGIGKLVVKIV
ncbi:hypothetical protein TruAng_005417 [Truncatella angustata]|nr:hypothetical protein TruAng_005417 [Truncatella angustata]